MSNINRSESEWNRIIEEFKQYKGTITRFCAEKGISRDSLFYQRKIRNLIDREEKSEISFTKINIKEPEIQNKTELSNYPKQTNIIEDGDSKKLNNKNTINIKIGKANMSIDAADKKTLSFIIKELSSVC
jgi:hypothetical protein